MPQFDIFAGKKMRELRRAEFAIVVMAKQQRVACFPFQTVLLKKYTLDALAASLRNVHEDRVEQWGIHAGRIRSGRASLGFSGAVFERPLYSLFCSGLKRGGRAAKAPK